MGSSSVTNVPLWWYTLVVDVLRRLGERRGKEVYGNFVNLKLL